MKTITLACMLAVALPASTALASDGAYDHVTRTVSYRDLDLSDPKQMTRLRTRIAAAIARVCTVDTRDLASLAAMARCRGDARAKAETRVAALTQRNRVRSAGVEDANEPAVAPEVSTVR